MGCLEAHGPSPSCRMRMGNDHVMRLTQVWLAAPCDVCGNAVTVTLRGISSSVPMRSKSPSSKSTQPTTSTASAVTSAHALAQALCALALHEFKASLLRPSAADVAAPPPPLPHVKIASLSPPSSNSDSPVVAPLPSFEFSFSDHPASSEVDEEAAAGGGGGGGAERRAAVVKAVGDGVMLMCR